MSGLPSAVLVVSGDAALRASWARVFEAQGARTLRCAGPRVTSCALLDHDCCPLLEEADCAVYEIATVTPGLLLRFREAPPRAELVFATRDESPLPAVQAHARRQVRSEASRPGDMLADAVARRA